MSESNIQASPGSIFICYRREDSADVTGRIYDRLVDHFGAERVFMDVEAIRLGYDFRSEIDQTIKVCSIVIVVIGDKWLAEADGKRRIDDENDRVRIEIESALRREIPIIPVLTRGTSHPTKAMLPASLEALAYRHGTSIRHEHFRGDVDFLISQMDKLLARRESIPSKPVEPKEPATPMASTQTTQSQPAIPPIASPLERHLDNLAKTVKAVPKSPPLPGANVPVQPERPPIPTPLTRSPSSRKSILIPVAIAILMIVAGAGWYLGHPRRVTPVVTPSSFDKAPAAIPASERIPPRPKKYFNDYAGVMSVDAVARFNEQLATFERETSNQVVVAVYLRKESTAPIDGYTRRVANAWGVGQADRQNGVLLFVFIEDRQMFMQVGGGLEDVLPNAKAFDITEHQIKPHFHTGDYEGGFKAGIDAICDATRNKYKGDGKTEPTAQPK